jgi:hypothetical protein
VFPPEARCLGACVDVSSTVGRLITVTGGVGRLPVNVGHYEDTFRKAGTTGCWQGGWPSSRSEARPSGCRRRLVTLAGNPALRTKLSHPLPRKIVTECRTAPG